MARATTTAVVVIVTAGLVLGASAGFAAYTVGTSATVSAPKPTPTGGPSATSPTPTPTAPPVPLPADCSTWLGDVSGPAYSEGSLEVTTVIDEPVRALQQPAAAALTGAQDLVWCDVETGDDSLTASLSVSRRGTAESVDLRTSLVAAGADCGPASGGVLCVSTVTYDPDDPSTVSASDLHYFRSGIWISASIQRSEFGSPQLLFRDAAAMIFPDLP